LGENLALEPGREEVLDMEREAEGDTSRLGRKGERRTGLERREGEGLSSRVAVRRR